VHQVVTKGMDVSNYLHTLGDKITYKLKDGKLKVYIRASNRGDRARIQQIRQRLFLWGGLGLFLFPVVILSVGTNFIIVFAAATVLWLLVLLRTIYTYLFKKDGMEILTVSTGILDYNSGLFSGSDRLILKRRQLNYPFDIVIKNGQTVVHGVQIIEEEKTSVISFSKGGDLPSLNLNLSPEIGEQLQTLILKHIRGN